MNSRRRKLLVGWTIYSLFALLLLPVIWYSLNTPFALIDDYNSWCILQTFSSLSGILNWVQNLLFHFGPGRFRPVFDLYNYITWSAFGDNYSLHHLMRLLLKLFTVFFSIRVISLFTARENNKFNLAVFTFLSIYLFFPNNPEARLAPLELEVTFFLSVIFYSIGKLFMLKNGDILLLSKKEYIILLISFALLSFSKEVSLAFTCIALLFIIFLNMSKKGILKLVPLTIPVIFTFFKAYFETQAGGYGTKPISYALMRNNFQWCLKYLLLYDASKVFIILLLLPIVLYLLVKAKDIRREPKVHPVIPDRNSHSLKIKARFLNMLLYDKELTLYIFLGLNFLAFFAVALTFWTPVLRYFYPLVYIMSLLIGISFARIGRVSIHSRKVKVITIVLCLYFVLGNYYNFMYQFAAQHSARINENRMLTSVKQLLEEHKEVYNVIQSEFEDKIGLYFNKYLPFFHNTIYRIQNVQQGDLFHKDIYYVTRNDVALPGHALKEKFINGHNLFLLRIAKSISSFVLCDKDPFYRIDAGTSIIGQRNWYIYENTLNLDDYRAGARVLYNSDRRIEVLGGEPYAESVVNLPKTLRRKHLFVIKLRYHTTGKPNPYLIVIQIPYKSDNVPLHDKIQISNSPTTIELAFSPRLDILTPRILFRNWASEGALIVEDIEVFEMNIDSEQSGPKEL